MGRRTDGASAGPCQPGPAGSRAVREESGRRESSPLASKRVGRVRGGRASPGAVVVLPFRRGDRPAWPLSTRPAGWRPFSGRTGVPDRPLPEGRKAERADRVSSGSIQRRAASKRRPSIDLRRGPPRLSSARASSLDHSPPSSRSVDPTPSPPTGCPDPTPAPPSGGVVTLTRGPCGAITAGWLLKV